MHFEKDMLVVSPEIVFWPADMRRREQKCVSQESRNWAASVTRCFVSGYSGHLLTEESISYPTGHPGLGPSLGTHAISRTRHVHKCLPAVLCAVKHSHSTIIYVPAL